MSNFNLFSGFPLLDITILLLILFIIFLIVREIMLWYWKINENTKNLERIADSLEIIAEQNNKSISETKDVFQEKETG